MPSSYMDIGHGLDAEHSLLWKISWTEPENEKEYSRPYVEVFSAQAGTHETIFGRENLGWRGRYDTRTKQASVVSSENEPWRSMAVPVSIVQLLKQKFCQDVEIWHFQMDGAAKIVA